MPGVHCGLAACWQLLLGLRGSPARGMVRLRNAAGWVSSSSRWRGVEGWQRHSDSPLPSGSSQSDGGGPELALKEIPICDEGERASRGYSQSDGGGSGPTFGGSQADGRCTACALGKLTVQGGRQSSRSEQMPTLAEETQPFSCGSPESDGVSAPAPEVPSIKKAS